MKSTARDVHMYHAIFSELGVLELRFRGVPYGTVYVYSLGVSAGGP